ncbi:hypothetical protein [Maribacter sp. 2307ULW6-5]|uniref:hypothetical protein n=1 Tax=Maribacter sp. 2307ULW6-5 TaxID=3386275 RepID=UPI0039BC3638
MAKIYFYSTFKDIAPLGLRHFLYARCYKDVAPTELIFQLWQKQSQRDATFVGKNPTNHISSVGAAPKENHG